MATDKQMLVRIDPKVKEFVDAAAAKEGISGNMFAQRAFIYYLQEVLPDLDIAGRKLAWCLHCGSRPLYVENNTPFCEKCQSAVGLPMLMRLYPGGVSSGRSRYASGRRGRRRFPLAFQKENP